MCPRGSQGQCRQRWPGPCPPNPSCYQREAIPPGVGAVLLRGITGSADSLQVGVTTLGYPSGLADPLDSTSVSAVEGQISAATATSTLSTSSSQLTVRQPSTTAEVTAAASRSPTTKTKQSRTADFAKSQITLGAQYNKTLQGVKGLDISKTNVPEIESFHKYCVLLTSIELAWCDPVHSFGFVLSRTTVTCLLPLQRSTL